MQCLIISSIILQVDQFLYGQLGLEYGVNAVITNGRVSFVLTLVDLNFVFSIQCIDSMSILFFSYVIMI